MLIKFLNVRKLAPFSRHVAHKPPQSQPEESPLVLKLVHAGGTVESYSMPVPASRIMEKYPSCVLARPEVFRRPWDSVVQPEQILNPGEKFFVVPRCTVKKLGQRIQKPNREISARSFVSQSSNDVSAEMICRKEDEVSMSKMFLQGSEISSSSEASDSNFSVDRRRSSVRSKHVRISGISPKHAEKEKEIPKRSSNPQAHGKKRRVRNAVTWQPTLTAISESSGKDE